MPSVVVGAQLNALYVKLGLSSDTFVLNTLSICQIAQVIVEFLEVAVSCIVFLKGAFERRRYMNIVVQKAVHPQLADYIHSVTTGLLPFIQKKFVFKLAVNQSYGSELEESSLEFALRASDQTIAAGRSPPTPILPAGAKDKEEDEARCGSIRHQGMDADAADNPIKSMGCDP
ncbi:hypothetical protein ZWY2020_019696 [Hordeum vulgare]|nr:hypothetical protein ZWY2020_019696 [Hordeum vulgare]